MNIVIPMAGHGSRFVDAGYKLPKPLIDVNGVPMIEAVVNNIKIYGTYIYLVQQQHIRNYPQLIRTINRITPNNRIIPIANVTEGAACTCLLAKKHINNNEPLLIANCDQIMDWQPTLFLKLIQENYCDGCILTFSSDSPKNSYVQVDGIDSFVTKCKEKEVISNLATCGVYYWSGGKDFVSSAESMIKRNIRVNNEFYVCPTYNRMISDGARIITHHVEQHYPIGTPEDLKKYTDLIKFHHCSHQYFPHYLDKKKLGV